MIKMQAVVEVPSFAEPPPWPVADRPARSWLVLDAHCTDAEVGLFVAAVAGATVDVPAPGRREDVVRALLAEEMLIVAGGLRVTDTATGVAVVPGCCAGLEDWRDWGRVLAGESPWLGHDPAPEVQFAGDDLRVWQHRGGPSVVVPRERLPGLLEEVRRDLVGFLAACDAWGGRPGLGAVVDRHFAVTAQPAG